MTQPQDFRERLPELLDERAPQRAPNELFDRFAERMETAPQRPGWATRERWFPMPTQVAVDQVRRTVVVMGALLLLVLAMAAAFVVGSRLVASTTTIIVAADGSGDVTTLGAGVAMAADGDTVLVRPGTYIEVVTVTQDVTIQGDGDIERIVISATDDDPSTETGMLAGRPVADQRYALLVIEADPTVRGLTFSGEPSAVVAIGGAPTITGDRFEGVGLRQDHEADRPDDVVVGINAIAIGDGSNTIEGSITGVSVVGEESSPTFSGNQLCGTTRSLSASDGATEPDLSGLGDCTEA